MGLVMWECLGAAHVDPKSTLRRLTTRELSMLVAHLEAGLEDVEKFAVVRMIRVEMLHRHGSLVGDWSFVRNGSDIKVHYSMSTNKVMQSHHQIETSGMAFA